MPIKDIEKYMSILGIKGEKAPTFADLKKSFRDKLSLHPDRAGAESTKEFQEITEAARLVFLFLVEHPELQPKKRVNR